MSDNSALKLRSVIKLNASPFKLKGEKLRLRDKISLSNQIRLKNDRKSTVSDK